VNSIKFNLGPKVDFDSGVTA